MMRSEETPILAKSKRPADELAKLSLSSTTMRWAQEREWRLLRDARGRASYSSAGAGRGVYLGARTSEDVTAAIKAALQPLSIPIYQMKRSEYELRFSAVKSPAQRRTPKIVPAAR